MVSLDSGKLGIISWLCVCASDISSSFIQVRIQTSISFPQPFENVQAKQDSGCAASRDAIVEASWNTLLPRDVDTKSHNHTTHELHVLILAPKSCGQTRKNHRRREGNSCGKGHCFASCGTLLSWQRSALILDQERQVWWSGCGPDWPIVVWGRCGGCPHRSDMSHRSCWRDIQCLRRRGELHLHAEARPEYAYNCDRHSFFLCVSWCVYVPLQCVCMGVAQQTRMVNCMNRVVLIFLDLSVSYVFYAQMHMQASKDLCWNAKAKLRSLIRVYSEIEWYLVSKYVFMIMHETQARCTPVLEACVRN